VDRVHIQQVILNLLVNAMEATTASGDRDPQIVIESRPTADGFVQVSVSDQGGGIAPDLVDQLFEPFFTTKADGMGMGLAISRSIVEAHGGRLWVAATGPSGTTFALTVPTDEAAQ